MWTGLCGTFLHKKELLYESSRKIASNGLTTCFGHIRTVYGRAYNHSPPYLHELFTTLLRRVARKLSDIFEPPKKTHNVNRQVSKLDCVFFMCTYEVNPLSALESSRGGHQYGQTLSNRSKCERTRWKERICVKLEKLQVIFVCAKTICIWVSFTLRKSL